MSRGLLAGMKSLLSSNVQVTGQGVVDNLRPRLAQNTMSKANSGRLQIFASGNPNLASHWLTMTTVYLSGDEEDGMEVTQVLKKSSMQSTVQIQTEKRCNRETCTGCPTEALLNMCYALRQCAIVNCVGSTVNLERPLCNLGLMMQSKVNKGLVLAQSAWSVFTESYSQLLQITLQRSSLDLEAQWVDDAFFGFVCEAKNVGADTAALLTSAFGLVILNSQRESFVDLDSGESVLIDTKTSVRSTAMLAGMTSALYQLTLFPLYSMIAMQKMATCTMSSMLAVVSTDGLKITIGRSDLSSASNVAGGMCLTSYFQNNINELADRGDGSAMAENIMSQSSSLGFGDVQKSINSLSNMATLGLTFNLRMTQHLADAYITYAMGVVSGIQDAAQTIDHVNCKLPDYYMYKTLTCACGDTAVVIAPSPVFATHDYWCRGSLLLTNALGKPMFVTNPYTFQELVERVHGPALQYLECLSRRSLETISCHWNPVDGLDDHEESNIVSIAVLQKCRSNYVLKEWDAGAFHQFLSTNVNPDTDDTIQCLLQAHAAGLGPGQCLDDFLFRSQTSRDEYFSYSAWTGDNFEKRGADACIVASGASKHSNPTIRNTFSACTRADASCAAATDTCLLSPMVWEGSTSNRIPVAYPHMVSEDTSFDTADELMTCAREQALAAITKNINYNNENVEAVLFSAEGDALHQVLNFHPIPPDHCHNYM